MRRSNNRRRRIVFWIISVLVVVSMALGLAVALIPPRRSEPFPPPASSRESSFARWPVQSSDTL